MDHHIPRYSVPEQGNNFDHPNVSKVNLDENQTSALHCWRKLSPQSTVHRRSDALGLEDMHGPDHKLPADGTFVHPLATLGAGHHVATLEEDTVDHRVHADPAEVVIMDCQGSLFTVCKEKNTTT